MIKLVPDHTFEAMAYLTVPGQPDPVEVPMTFNHMTADEVSEWFKVHQGKPAHTALDEIITDWTGVMGEDGKYVPYSITALEVLLKNYQPSTSEIIRAWQKGLTESRIKN